MPQNKTCQQFPVNDRSDLIRQLKSATGVPLVIHIRNLPRFNAAIWPPSQLSKEIQANSISSFVPNRTV